MRFSRRLNSSSHGQGLSCELWPEGGDHTTHSWRIRVAWAQIVFDDSPQSLTFGRGLCNFQHAASHLVECPCHRFDEQVVLALKMPVEAPFRQAYLLHYRADAAAVTAVLAERASGHGNNLLVVLRFVFRRVPHVIRVRSYSYFVKSKTMKHHAIALAEAQRTCSSSHTS